MDIEMKNMPDGLWCSNVMAINIMCYFVAFVFKNSPVRPFISKMSNVLNSLKTLISLEKYGLETA